MARTPKPTALKVLEGVRPCRIKKDEPKPEVGLGKPPAFLDAVGLEAWKRLAPKLEAMGVGTSADADALAVYCSAFSRYRMCLAEIEIEGLTTSSQMGDKPNTHLVIIEKCEKTMLTLMRQFGMTPASRSGLSVADKPEDDDLLAYFRPKAALDGKRRSQK
jgi:P27 family predicted phage terminase small subunit